MTDILISLEASGPAAWLRESGSIWAYPLVLTLHTLGLSMLVGGNTALDLRILGFAPGIPLTTMARTFTIMWVGFWINTASGVWLFAADATTKGSTRLFLWKLALVAVGVIALLLTKRSVYGRTDVDARPGGAARGLAAVSLVVWVAAIAAGRFMAY